VEPFNLREERERGYFDESGNYIEYRFEDTRDAWLDAIDAVGSLSLFCFLNNPLHIPPPWQTWTLNMIIMVSALCFDLSMVKMKAMPA
jgi:hypothetical protein